MAHEQHDKGECPVCSLLPKMTREEFDELVAMVDTESSVQGGQRAGDSAKRAGTLEEP